MENKQSVYEVQFEWEEAFGPMNSCPLPMSNVTGILVSVIFHGLQFLGLCLPSTGLGSAPYIHVEGPAESGVQLVCTAKGWFPEPQVYWADITGEKLLAISEHSIQDENGLFYVETTLVVRNDSVETVSCFIHNPILNEEKSSIISIPGQSSTSTMNGLVCNVINRKGLFHST